MLVAYTLKLLAVPLYPVHASKLVGCLTIVIDEQLGTNEALELKLVKEFLKSAFTGFALVDKLKIKLAHRKTKPCNTAKRKFVLTKFFIKRKQF